jgi:subtilisin family serine protease
MNMSLGGSKSTALNSAIAALTKAGVTVVVAAGNENVSTEEEGPLQVSSQFSRKLIMY